jgi:hypothetical protein
MYGEPVVDGGEGFEEYLTRLDLSGLPTTPTTG